MKKNQRRIPDEAIPTDCNHRDYGRYDEHSNRFSERPDGRGGVERVELIRERCTNCDYVVGVHWQ